MAEQNVWRNYQTKLLGGGLLLVAIIIIAAFLSQSNHPTPVKQEVELTLEPAAQPKPANIDLTTSSPSHPESMPATEITEPALSKTATQRPEPTVSAMPLPPASHPPAYTTATAEQAMAEPPAVSTIKPVVTTAVPTALPRVKTLVSHPSKSKYTTAAKLSAKSAVQQPKAKRSPSPKTMPVKYTAKNLHAIPAQHYTIQLLGVNSKRNALLFMKNHRLPGKALYYQTVNQGKPWHVVIYGEFQTKAQAHIAMRKLPAALLKLKPFVRSYAEVHKAIKPR